MNRRSSTSAAAVVFDCDGVLVDSERVETTVIEEALGWLGLGHDAETLAEVHVGGKLSRLFDDFERLNGSLPDGFADRYRERQMELLARVEPIPGVFDAVRVAGERRAVASGGPLNKMELTLGAVGLWESFAPHIYSCYDVGDHKPAPDVYLHTARQLGVDASSCVVIEDSDPGVRAAVSAGMLVIGFSRDTDADKLLRAGSHATTNDLAGVVELLIGEEW